MTDHPAMKLEMHYNCCIGRSNKSPLDRPIQLNDGSDVGMQHQAPTGILT